MLCATATTGVSSPNRDVASDGLFLSKGKLPSRALNDVPSMVALALRDTVLLTAEPMRVLPTVVL